MTEWGDGVARDTFSLARTSAHGIGFRNCCPSDPTGTPDVPADSSALRAGPDPRGWSCCFLPKGAPPAHRQTVPLGTAGSVLERAIGGSGLGRLVPRGVQWGRWPDRRSLRGVDPDHISMRVVIVPPQFEGLPTASSQTVPMNGCFVFILSLRERGTTATERTGSPRLTSTLSSARRPR